MIGNEGYAKTIYSSDSAKPEAGCSFWGIEGSYKENPKDYITRINKIRLNACKVGEPDPRDPSRKLKLTDYVPLKWSADLQYIARIRAAESSVYPTHTRTNGNSTFTTKSANNMTSSSEVLAWGADGIYLWNQERQAWLNQDDSQVTGHYEAMINPNFTYFAISYFTSSTASWSKSYAGEFTSKKGGLSEVPLANVSNIIQTVEISNSCLGSYQIVAQNQKNYVNKGKKNTFCLKISVNYDNAKSSLCYIGDIKWSSSNKKIATVSSKGIVKGKKYGKFYLKAKINGKIIKKQIKVQPKFSAVSISAILASSKSRLKVKWKKGSKIISGYQLQYSPFYNFNSGNRTITIKGRKKTSSIVKVKGGKFYYFRIRSFKKVGKNKFYSAWKNYSSGVMTW